MWKKANCLWEHLQQAPWKPNFAWKVTNFHCKLLVKIGCITFACPIPIARPSNFLKFFVIYVHDCLICNENFHYNDICVASCGHCYHLWCLIVQCTSWIKYQVKGCDQEFGPSWQLSFGFFNKVEEKTNSPM